jgi:hypothetical protein
MLFCSFALLLFCSLLFALCSFLFLKVPHHPVFQCVCITEWCSSWEPTATRVRTERTFPDNTSNQPTHHFVLVGSYTQRLNVERYGARFSTEITPGMPLVPAPVRLKRAFV